LRARRGPGSKSLPRREKFPRPLTSWRSNRSVTRRNVGRGRAARGEPERERVIPSYQHHLKVLWWITHEVPAAAQFSQVLGVMIVRCVGFAPAQGALGAQPEKRAEHVVHARPRKWRVGRVPFCAILCRAGSELVAEPRFTKRPSSGTRRTGVPRPESLSASPPPRVRNSARNSPTPQLPVRAAKVSRSQAGISEQGVGS
jgi:hypothetical protein